MTEHDTTELDRVRAPSRALEEAVIDGKIRMTELLMSVGIDAGKPEHQAALLACERYGLDPLLKHIIVIPRGGVYITADGYRHVAEMTGEHNGTTVVEQGETPSHFTAVVSVWRKGVDHAFTFPGRYPKAGSNKKHGAEMAIVRAERNALSRAFPVAGIRAEPDPDRAAADTSALTAEIHEHVAVREWVGEHGDPTELDPADEAPTLDLDTDE